MTDTFGTQIRIDLVDLLALGDRAVRALGLANVAVNAFIVNHQGHDNILRNNRPGSIEDA
jgi:hypothetical protein